MNRFLITITLITYSLASWGQGLGVDIAAPVSMLHVYENTTITGAAAGVTVEQGSTGDAVTQFLLTATQRYAMGIDNNDADKFKLATNADVGTNTAITITTTGDVGIGVASPKELLQVGQSTTGPSKIQVKEIMVPISPVNCCFRKITR